MLSGKNNFSGPTQVTQGTLSLANARSLGTNTEVSIAAGATLELNFKGQISVRQLTLDGKPQPPGSYTAATAPGFLKGNGVLHLQL